MAGRPFLGESSTPRAEHPDPCEGARPTFSQASAGAGPAQPRMTEATSASSNGFA